MTDAQLLEKLRGVLLPPSPGMKMSPPLQVPKAHISTREFQNEQSNSSAMRTNGKPAAERVQRSSFGNPVITDKGVADRTPKTLQFFNHHDKPSSQAKSIRARCQAWLKSRLNDGPVPLSEIKKEAQQLGFSAKALRVVRGQLGVRSVACLSLPGDKVLDHEHSTF